ncbi:MAG: response regulator transcription factor [Sphingomonadales bacterium]|nr:response regulator transcription factor [Sphingomonadales bacterium]
MNRPVTVLVVDDEPAIRRLLHTGIARAGYRVVEAGTAREALSAVQIDKPDVALLDLGLPDRDGLELINLMKAAGTAVVVVSARDATEQKVTALDLGADDYVTKPFDTEEVLARIRTALRHRLSSDTETPLVKIGDIEIDLAARMVRKAGVEVHFTPKEYAFLAELSKRPGKVVTHSQLLRSVWGAGHESDVEYLRVAARGIRKKLEDDPSMPSVIRNDPGVGYRLVTTA